MTWFYNMLITDQGSQCLGTFFATDAASDDCSFLSGTFVDAVELPTTYKFQFQSVFCGEEQKE